MNIIDLLNAALRIASPLMLAAFGGVLSERAGVFAVGLEGMMLAGAFGAAFGSALGGGIVPGLLAAAGCGGAIGLVVAAVAVRARADHMVTGLAVNILATGATSYGVRLAPPDVPALAPLAPVGVPVLDAVPIIGPLFAQPPLTWLTALVGILVALFLRRTSGGLTLRATGENPEAVRAAGGWPRTVRVRAVIAGGLLAGLGGAVLVWQVGRFTDNMTGGRGYLALASLIVGRWHPAGAALACIGFGLAEAFEYRLAASGVGANPYLMQMLPYLVALAVLGLVGRSARMPAAIGKPLA